MRLSLLICLVAYSAAFEIPKLGNIFKPQAPATPPGVSVSEVSRDKIKQELLEAVSFTANGKDATPEQQSRVLSIVRELETKFPVSASLLSNDTELRALDGTWFLQYTSPSSLDGNDEFPEAWKPEYADEGEAKIETKQFKSKGSVSAAGVKVDTSNRSVKQVFDVSKSSVLNEVELDFGVGRAGGLFRQSPNVPNRALVAFNEASISFNNGIILDLSWVFSITAVLRKAKENGWLETTYLDSEVRIGRGNKGTMFVLTRDQDAVKP